MSVVEPCTRVPYELKQKWVKPFFHHVIGHIQEIL
eukprot:CAMPEP_0198711868 /NCGR_PEP_ID=MMETSP1471-20131121/3843_1 /TAXON_ID=41880 /ORGANISM="Pycnococcus provasolii, Strain RCC733" /LENGTH=34 /DNA_ID= /DNA_START= /DNA_END= /DNA_ORIENTATION=